MSKELLASTILKEIAMCQPAAPALTCLPKAVPAKAPQPTLLKAAFSAELKKMLAQLVTLR